MHNLSPDFVQDCELIEHYDIEAKLILVSQLSKASYLQPQACGILLKSTLFFENHYRCLSACKRIQ